MKKIILTLIIFNIITSSAFSQCWQSVYTGQTRSYGIKSDGTLWGWGAGTYLGNGPGGQYLTPIQIGTGNNWQSISVGFQHVIAIKTDGSVWCWGSNSNGQLGRGSSSISFEYYPVSIGLPLTYSQCNSISVGDNHSNAIKANGMLYNWGSNAYDQLAYSGGNEFSPTQVSTGTNWQSISARINHNLAIKTDGTLWAWGLNDGGQLGTTGYTIQSPTQIGTSTNWQYVSTGKLHSISIKTDGTLWAWGNNSYGQLGDGTNVNKPTPIQIGTDTNWLAIAAGRFHTVAIKTNGTLWSWGYNGVGQLGDGTTIDKNIPTQIGSGTNWQKICASDDHTLALKSNGTIWAWGANNAGVLGDGTSVEKHFPTFIGSSGCSQSITLTNVIENNTSFPNPKVIWNYPSTSNAKICADASKATRIKFVNTTIADINNIRFRIRSDMNEQFIDSCGRFTDYTIIGDTIFAKFEHPKYLSSNIGIFKHDTIRIVDINNLSNIFYNIPIQIYRAPVIMVHGLWGDEASFKAMKDSFDNSGKYLNYSTKQLNYPESSHMSFDFNKYKIPFEINSILRAFRNNNISTGKVNVVAHSMGGILTRQYLQSLMYLPRNDIFKFLCINTPHSGSQLGNLVTNLSNPTSEKVRTITRQFHWLYKPFSTFGSEYDIDGGAVSDLSVGSAAMQSLNDPVNLQFGHVPSHAIVTNANVTSTNTIDDITIFAVTSNKFYYAIAGTTPPQQFVDYLFLGNSNDLVVTTGSQSGGLPASAITPISSIWHIGSPSKPQIISEILNGLDLNSNSNYYWQGGFAPVSQGSNYKQITDSNTAEQNFIIQGSVHIDSAISNQNYFPGNIFNIDVTSNNGINRIILLVTSNGKDFYSIDTNVGNFIIPYTIPNGAFSQIRITALGYNSLGLIGYDTLHIGVNMNATLDSIRFTKDTLVVLKNYYTSVPLKAYYSNGYNFLISSSLGASYQIMDTLKAKIFQSDLFLGKDTGSTYLTANYYGQSVTIPVLILDEDTSLSIDTLSFVTFPLPISEIKIEGNSVENSDLIKWITKNENNIKLFRLQHSTDGSDFQSISEQNSKQTTVNSEVLNYEARNDHPIVGHNFYRIELEDLDGRKSYSKTLDIFREGDGSTFLIYPNPFSDEMKIEIYSSEKTTLYCTLTDLQGRLINIFDWKIIQGKNTKPLNLKTLTTGEYIFNATNSKGSIYTHKVSKN